MNNKHADRIMYSILPNYFETIKQRSHGHQTTRVGLQTDY
jgi:hypothetical protein